ncbi:MAG: phosphotransferase, partial [Chloroflexales bacterium]|nr:phosphotransferase [Chloroflexales bacterium]
DALTDLGRPPHVADVATSLARNNALPGREPGDDDEGAGMRYLLTQVPQGYNPLDVADIVAVAHSLGGVAVLAHPGRSKGVYAIPATAHDVAALVAAGLDGIEVYYPAHTPDQQALYAELARRHGLLVTGGSDSHHPRQPLVGVDAGPCEAFLARVGIVI